MKIMRCPNCQGAVVVNNLDNNFQKIISCIHCGFCDYAYIFYLSHTSHSSHRKPNEMTVADVIQTISLQLKDRDLSYIDINQFIYDLHSRCKEFSPIIICKLINAFLEHSENAYEKSDNETLFVEYESENITLDDIYQKMIDFQYNYVLKMVGDDSFSAESSNMDCLLLEKELQLKQLEIDTWIKEYNLLLEKYQKAMDENETLKFLFQKKNK